MNQAQPPQTEIATKLASIQQRITAAAVGCGRNPAEIRLLPVSKIHPATAVVEAYNCGYRRFGENKVQEAYLKCQELSQLPGLQWAVIGHLQTNKAKLVAQFATEFQALDSLRVAAELDRRLQAEGRQLEVLIQVNSSNEDQKFGLPPGEVLQFSRQLRAFDALNVTGLMTLALFTPDPVPVAACFKQMQQLQQELRQLDGGGWDELSMGMSRDFELAIEHGATCVRIGEAIFGSRLDAAKYWPGV